MKEFIVFMHPRCVCNKLGIESQVTPLTICKRVIPAVDIIAAAREFFQLELPRALAVTDDSPLLRRASCVV